MWCPLCAREYRAGFSRCSRCGAALVDEEPRIPSGLLRDRLFGERSYKACWYYESPVLLFDAAQEAVRTSGLQARLVESSRLVIVARKPSRFDRLVNGAVEVAVASTESADGRCLVQVWAWASWRSAGSYQSSGAWWAEAIHARLQHAS